MRAPAGKIDGNGRSRLKNAHLTIEQRHSVSQAVKNLTAKGKTVALFAVWKKK